MEMLTGFDLVAACLQGLKGIAASVAAFMLVYIVAVWYVASCGNAFRCFAILDTISIPILIGVLKNKRKSSTKIKVLQQFYARAAALESKSVFSRAHCRRLQESYDRVKDVYIDRSEEPKQIAVKAKEELPVVLPVVPKYSIRVMLVALKVAHAEGEYATFVGTGNTLNFSEMYGCAEVSWNNNVAKSVAELLGNVKEDSKMKVLRGAIDFLEESVSEDQKYVQSIGVLNQYIKDIHKY